MQVDPDIHDLERLTLATSPALREERYDDWVLRASGTDTRRANSVTQFGAGALPLVEKVAYCERWYAVANQPSTFRLTSSLSPFSLDALLEERGYAMVTPSHVMTAKLGGASGAQDTRLMARAPAEGIADLHRLKGSDPALAQRDQVRQSQWNQPEHHLALIEAGELCACGMVRVDGPWAGIFNMRTATAHRGKGMATALVQGLLAWAKSRGASQAFLQVEQANEPAVRLYRKAGFSRRYDYHYRVAA